METQKKNGGLTTRNGTRTGRFDYGRLIKSKREAIRKHTEVIRNLLKQTVRTIYAVACDAVNMRCDNLIGHSCFL